jgi:Delta7-sterol 5-desaturase
MPPPPLPWLVLVVSTFFLAATAVGLAVGYALERTTQRKVWDLPLFAGQTRHELKGNVGFIALSVLFGVLFWRFELIRFGPDSLGRSVATFFFMWVAFQAYYYWLHRALHLRRLVRFHRHHHESRVTTPLSGQSTSLVEAVGWMGGYFVVPALASLVVPLGFWGFVAYLAFNVTGNIIGHANAELTPPSPFLWAASVVTTAFTYHALHHARWTGHYGFASTWADRLFGTEWNDWPSLHARVWRQEPLDNLKIKGSPRARPQAVAGPDPPAA